MKKLIGFATEFYTLWEYQSTPVYSSNEVVNGVTPMVTGYNHEYFYLKNISKDLAKVKALYPGVAIDEDLRGVSRSFQRWEKVEPPAGCFTFGKLVNQLISDSTDVWQLRRACGLIDGRAGEPSPRRRVLARRRLIDLGELVRFPHYKVKHVNVNWGKRDEAGKYLPEDYQDIPYLVNYETPKFVEIEREKKAAQARPHYFTDGERLTLSVKLTGRFGFHTVYGFTTVCLLETSEGLPVKYMGANPPNFNEDGFTQVTATIKHTEYKGAKETHLQRIKVL